MNAGKIVKTIITMAISTQFAGCANTSCCLSTTTETADSVKYIIIGFGIVTVPKNNRDNGILAVKTQSLGILVSDQPGAKFSAGYSSGTTVSIPHDADSAVVEVRSCSNDGITVKAITDVKH